MSARKGAARCRKFKKWALEVWSFAKGYLSFSKLLVYAVLYIDYKSTMTTLDLGGEADYFPELHARRSGTENRVYRYPLFRLARNGGGGGELLRRSR